MAYMLGSSTFR